MPLAAAWYQLRQTRDLTRTGRNAEALQAAQTAVDLAPESPLTQLELAHRLSERQQWPEALAHYQTAQQEVSRLRAGQQGDSLGSAIAKGLADAQAHAIARP